MISHSKYDIELSIACRDLIDLDTFTKTDPFARIYEQKGEKFELIGVTEVVYNNLNPNFNKSIRMDFYFESKQPIKVEIYHKKSSSSEEFIGRLGVIQGSVDFLLSSVTGKKDDILEMKMPGNKGLVGFVLQGAHSVR